MENKYYTPELSEFHFGFEFEIGVDEAGFKTTLPEEVVEYNQKTFNPYYGDDIDEVRNYINRVKHLDREDIEELGWNMTNTNSNGDLKQYRLNSYFLQVTYIDGTKLILIKEIIDFFSGKNQTLFFGTIKNKSELKKLMQQLNILK